MHSFQLGELRFQSGAGATINFDEIRMGSRYIDVAPLAPVPEPDARLTWVVGVGLIGLIAVRRRVVA